MLFIHALGSDLVTGDLCEKSGAPLKQERATGEENTWRGGVGDIATSSFYPPHHMTMGEGGAVYTANPLLHKIVRSLRDWGRDCVCPSGRDNVCGHRFDGQRGELPAGYDHKYTYSHLGYNLKATATFAQANSVSKPKACDDMQAAVGCAQIEKIASFTQKRRHNWQFLRATSRGTPVLMLYRGGQPTGFRALLMQQSA